MTAIKILSGLCELFLYISTAGTVLGLCGAGENPGFVLAVLGLILVSGALLEKHRAAFAAAAAVLSCFFLLPVQALNGFSPDHPPGVRQVIAGLFLILPPLTLIFVRFRRKAFYRSYDRMVRTFRIGLILLPIWLLASVIFQADRTAYQTAALFYSGFLILSVWSLRLLRAPDLFSDRKFRLFNLLIPAVLLALVFLFGSRYVLTPLWTALGWLYTNVISKALIILLLLVGWPVMLFVQLFSGLLQGSDASPEQEEAASSGSDLLGSLIRDRQDTSALPSWVLPAVLILLALCVLVMILVLIRKHVSADRMPGGDSDIVRTAVSSPAPSRKTTFFRDPVRALYRKYLKLCRKKKIDTSGGLASDRILRKSEACFTPAAASALRAEWLKVRYGEIPSTETELENAKKAFDSLR